ncbi:lipocalin-like domain-containing protein [Dactylosporangium sp. CS-047395]|uniref:lipocalin-like domain-containing protein n=1 Tax=Dactylosporangium sp. CS-047395 TaxID=3239936 RepID=UPI003D9508BF
MDAFPPLVIDRFGNEAGEAAMHRLGLTEHVSSWENAIREPTGPGHAEYWYLDAHLNDDSIVTVTLATKDPGGDPDRDLTPIALVHYHNPNGVSLTAETVFAGGEFAARRDHSEVRIGPNTLTGDLHHCHLVVNDPHISLNLTFNATVPPVRLGTGRKIVSAREHYIGWLIAMPHAHVTGTLTTHGHTRQVHGDGYHDHTWCNVPVTEYLCEGYRAHGRLGDEILIFGSDRSTPSTGELTLPFLVRFRDDHLTVTDRRGDLTVERHRPHRADLLTDHLQFSWHNPDNPETITIDVTDTDLLRTDIQQALRYRQYRGHATLNATIDGRTQPPKTGTLIFDNIQLD